jgi:uncharacterized protein YaaQ
VKLILTIVQDADAPKLQNALLEHGLRSTKLASTGGFLREGNTTFLLGVEDHQVERAKAIIHDVCRERSKMLRPLPHMSEMGPVMPNEPIEVTIGGATVFVLDVEEFAKL